MPLAAAGRLQTEAARAVTTCPIRHCPLQELLHCVKWIRTSNSCALDVGGLIAGSLLEHFQPVVDPTLGNSGASPGLVSTHCKG